VWDRIEIKVERQRSAQGHYTPRAADSYQIFQQSNRAWRVRAFYLSRRNNRTLEIRICMTSAADWTARSTQGNFSKHVVVSIFGGWRWELRRGTQRDGWLSGADHLFFSLPPYSAQCTYVYASSSSFSAARALPLCSHGLFSKLRPNRPNCRL
jgi:hypothetical protein